MPYRYHTADVFTSTAFGGNQLAVVPDARGLTDDQMLAIAREFNFSESVFVLPPVDPANTRRLRIFTPGAELPFAGHPTVGTAFVLAATGEIILDGDETRIIFEEGVGPVPVLIRSANGGPVFTQLTAAKIPEMLSDRYDAATLAELLSLKVDDIEMHPHAIEAWSAGVPFLFVPITSRDALSRARVRMEVWERTLKGSVAPEIFVFVGDGESIVRARMFAPTLGIPEDPATGGAAAAFGGYLASQSDIGDGMLRCSIHQGVEMGRPSLLQLEVDIAGGDVKAVRVGGASVLVSSGTLHVP
jgi:trans-2,3-dihydro-3-hydroxyanthranilate isomerase